VEIVYRISYALYAKPSMSTWFGPRRRNQTA